MIGTEIPSKETKQQKLKGEAVKKQEWKEGKAKGTDLSAAQHNVERKMEDSTVTVSEEATQHSYQLQNETQTHKKKVVEFWSLPEKKN